MPETSPPPRTFRVLIVEDNDVNRQVFEMMLDAGGFRHAAVGNGRLGVEAAQTGLYDLILMDIQMPVMDGLEATRRIRAWERETGRGRLPIYIVSANCMAEDVAAGRIAGADGHFPKPVAVAQLLSALRSHAEAARLAA
jgi:CheY-like chemotaxis protein